MTITAMLDRTLQDPAAQLPQEFRADLRAVLADPGSVGLTRLMTGVCYQPGPAACACPVTAVLLRRGTVAADADPDQIHGRVLDCVDRLPAAAAVREVMAAVDEAAVVAGGPSAWADRRALAALARALDAAAAADPQPAATAAGGGPGAD
jgi:hypothetical protein